MTEKGSAMPNVFLHDQPVAVANIFCIGRNYAAHAAEMGSIVETEPLVFLKPNSALCLSNQPIILPDFSHEVHHEAELVLLIGKTAHNVSVENALDYVAGYALGLDLTARDTQSIAKQKGQPWTKSKGFKNAACVSNFIMSEQLPNPNDVSFQLEVNGEIRQTAHTRLMAFSCAYLVSYLSEVYGLSAGDLIYTGTPEGVAKLNKGDAIMLTMGTLLSAAWQVS
jgi:2-keto-4-pentenoate hydratase/2-oxohepta-3-ene-1,7-dioic acid hydratase in catechol pathway